MRVLKLFQLNSSKRGRVLKEVLSDDDFKENEKFLQRQYALPDRYGYNETAVAQVEKQLDRSRGCLKK